MGATIDPLTGQFSWTPGVGFEETNSVIVRVTDDSASALFDFKSFDITVNSNANNAPVLDPIGNQAVDKGSLLTFTATASDPNPTDTLTFSLDAGFPPGASIDANSGVFTWTPTEAQGPGVFNVTVRVTDDGAGNLDDFEFIRITVNTPRPSADFDDSGVIDGFDFLQWQRGFGTTGAVNADGDADYDGEVNGDDLAVWESQYGQPASAIDAVSSSVVAAHLAADPIASFQFEATAPIASTLEEPVASRFPANLILRSSSVGPKFSLTALQHESVEAEVIAEYAEYIDEAFNSVWTSPEQNDVWTSDEFVLAADGDSTEATRSADEVFTLLADEDVFAGL